MAAGWHDRITDWMNRRKREEDGAINLADVHDWLVEECKYLGRPRSLQGDEVLIRAERAGAGDGRVYTVSVTATDGFGESCSGSVQVTVPHSMKKGVVPVDGGPRYVSTTP